MKLFVILAFFLLAVSDALALNSTQGDIPWICPEINPSHIDYLNRKSGLVAQDAFAVKYRNNMKTEEELEINKIENPATLQGVLLIVNLTKDNLETVCQVTENEIDSSHKFVIVSVEKDAFVNYGSNIQLLSLTGNPFENLEPGTFQSLTGVTELKLRVNSLSSLPMDLFGKENNLRELVLDSNRFNILDPRQFQNYAKLESLRLSKNKISKIVGPFQSENANLKELILKDNIIESIDEGVFQNLTNMTYLDLSFNRISSVHPRFMDANNKLSSLDLNGNRLKIVSESMFMNLNSLVYLYLSYNRISVIQTSFAPNNNLINFQLSCNQIEVIDAAAFRHLTKLLGLSLFGNLIQKIDADSFQSNQGLNYLDLSWNKLTTIEPGTLQNMENLTTLDLSWNNLTKIEPIDIYCNKFKTLNLCRNSLEFINEENCQKEDIISNVWKEKYNLTKANCLKSSSQIVSNNFHIIFICLFALHFLAKFD